MRGGTHPPTRVGRQWAVRALKRAKFSIGSPYGRSGAQKRKDRGRRAAPAVCAEPLDVEVIVAGESVTTCGLPLRSRRGWLSCRVHGVR